MHAGLPCYGRTETRNAHEKEPERGGKRSQRFQDQDGAGPGAADGQSSRERSTGGKVALNHCYTKLSEAERAKRERIKARAGGIVSKPGESFPGRTPRLHLFSLICSEILFLTSLFALRFRFAFPLDRTV